MDRHEFNKLDFQMVLMRHLDRIGIVTSSAFIDAINTQLATQYVNPPSTGEKALEWGVYFLQVIIPDGIRDAKFLEEMQVVLDMEAKKENISFKDFNRLHVLINLLDRKGLLLPHRRGGVLKKKDGVEETDVDEIELDDGGEL